MPEDEEIPRSVGDMPKTSIAAGKGQRRLKYMAIYANVVSCKRESHWMCVIRMKAFQQGQRVCFVRERHFGWLLFLGLQCPRTGLVNHKKRVNAIVSSEISTGLTDWLDEWMNYIVNCDSVHNWQLLICRGRWFLGTAVLPFRDNKFRYSEWKR